MKGTTKQAMKGMGVLIGNAGEHYVMAELLRRGIVAGLAPRNAPAFDIFASKGDKTVRIRVKTKSARARIWHWAAKKDGALFRELSREGDFTVLVDIAEETKGVDYFVAPTLVIDEWLRADFDRWLRTPGKGGRPHNPDNRVRGFYRSEHAERLEAYRNAWDSLWR